MAGARMPSTVGTSGEPHYLDDGTAIRSPSPRPGPVGMDHHPTLDSARPQQALLSPVFRDTVQVVDDMPAEQRGRMAAREYTGLGFGVASGAGGAWAGCVTFAALGSPSLVLPVVGEVTEGTLCAVGGILGGLGVGWAGREAGKATGETVFDFVTTFRWE